MHSPSGVANPTFQVILEVAKLSFGTQLMDASVFVSSTFLDMQKERDILSRGVFPRLRKQFADQFATIREIDLRWGITTAMSQQAGASNICFDEIERCSPLTLGLIGKRIGWRPDLTAVSRRRLPQLNPLTNDIGLTELELRLAAKLASNAKLIGPTILVRADELSDYVHTEGRLGKIEDPEYELADRISRLKQMRSAQLISYSTFSEFEVLAEQSLAQMLSDYSRMDRRRVSNDSIVRKAEIDRSQEIQKLGNALRRQRPVLLFGAPGSGKSWVLSSWVEKTKAAKIFDGRQSTIQEIARYAGAVLPPAGTGFDAALTSLATALARHPKGTVFAVDHFDDAFSVSDQADLSWFEAGKCRGAQLLVATSSDRLLHQAQGLGWSIVRVASPDQSQMAVFAKSYLSQYGKHLTYEQLIRISSAPCARHLSDLGLALDELRRFGKFDELDHRIGQLADSGDGVGISREVIQGFDTLLEDDSRRAVRELLAAFAISRRGLTEAEIIQLLGPSQSPSPATLWSAIQLSFASAFRRTEGRVDLNDGPLLKLAQALTGELETESLGAALLFALSGQPQRMAEEGPRVAYALGGETRLASWFADPDRTLDCAQSDSGNAVGWMSRLSGNVLDEVESGWLAAARSDQQRYAWPLGELALQSGHFRLGLALCAMDRIEQSNRPDRDLLVAFVTKDAAWFTTRLSDLRSNLDRGREPSANSAALMPLALLLAAEGQLVMAPQAAGDFTKTVELWMKTTGKNRPIPADVHLALGQMALVRTKNKAAEASFGWCQRLARASGSARMLARSLERSATAQIEQNKFRAARRSAQECRDLSYRLGMKELETLAFKRLIEIETRRANWEAAFTHLEALYRRSSDGMCHREEADHMKQYIDQTSVADNRRL